MVGDGIQVRRVTSGWIPSTVTWATQPTNTTENAITNKSSVGRACMPAPMNWDITAIARQWADDVGNYGLVLMSPTEHASNNYRVFPSSEDIDFNNPPKVTATFDPIGGPATVSPAGPKAAWIRDMFAFAAEHPRLRAIVWFDLLKERDWRATSPAAAITVLQAALARNNG